VEGLDDDLSWMDEEIVSADRDSLVFDDSPTDWHSKSSYSGAWQTLQEDDKMANYSIYSVRK